MCQAATVTITTSDKTVPMGRSARITAEAQAFEGPPEDQILLPFVNGRRWGAHERPDAAGKAVFLLPLPNVGPAHIQVVALPSDTDHWMGLAKSEVRCDRDLLMVGRRMPDQGVRSNELLLEVTWRDFPERPESDTLFCMQWETWFQSGPAHWETAQGVPLIGFYDSFFPQVTRQHMLWFMDLGIDFVMIDWSNHLWGCRHWDERGGGASAILHCTQVALEEMAKMRDEGLPVPKLVLMPGLSNGRPTTMEALNEQLAWIYDVYLKTPRFRDLWQAYDGKPLMIILDTGAVGHPDGTAASAFKIPFFKETLALSEAELDAFRQAQGPADDSQFTIRWMSSQNQATRHHELGYWSWMDGVIDPPVTYQDGVAESVVVTPAYFNAQGWTGPLARGRRGGTTYLETFKVALAHRPRVVHLHQFNECTGQREGHGRGPDHAIYLDTYSVELSDDLEPTSLTAPGYRGDGGWGFTYMNVTRALIDIYRGVGGDTTLLAIGSPLAGETVSGDVLSVSWSAVGAPVRSTTVAVDGVPIVLETTETQVTIPVSGLAPGEHRLTVIANGATTRYRLSSEAFDDPLPEPVPVEIHVRFCVAKLPSQRLSFLGRPGVTPRSPFLNGRGGL